MAYYKAFPVKKGKFLPNYNVTKQGLPVLPLNELIYHGIDYEVEFISVDGATLYQCEGCGFNNCYQLIDDIEELKGYKFLSTRVYSTGGYVQIIMKEEDSISAVHTGETSVVPAIQVKPRVVAVVCDEERDIWRYQYCPVLNPLNTCNFWKPKIVTDGYVLHSIERTMSMLALRFKKNKMTVVEQSLPTDSVVVNGVWGLDKPKRLAIADSPNNSVNCAIKRSKTVTEGLGQNCAIDRSKIVIEGLGGRIERPTVIKKARIEDTSLNFNLDSILSSQSAPKARIEEEDEPMYWKHRIEQVEDIN